MTLYDFVLLKKKKKIDNFLVILGKLKKTPS